VDHTWEGMRGAESGAAGNRIESGSETVGSRGMTGGDHLSAAVGGGEAGRCRWLLGRGEQLKRTREGSSGCDPNFG
jgi:hypothetical protein